MKLNDYLELKEAQRAKLKTLQADNYAELSDCQRSDMVAANTLETIACVPDEVRLSLRSC